MYELAVLYKVEVADRLDAVQKRLLDLLTSAGAKIIHSDVWGQRKLAYEIEKQASAIYAFYNFEIDGQQLNDLRSRLNIDRDVLRYLFYKLEEGQALEVKATSKKAKVKNGGA